MKRKSSETLRSKAMYDLFVNGNYKGSFETKADAEKDIVLREKTLGQARYTVIRSTHYFFG